MQPIVVVTEEKESGGTTNIGIRNVSSVPALNVTYQTYGEPSSPQSQRIPVFTNAMSLSAGRLQHFVLFKHGCGESACFDVEYESVSGRRYRTVGEWDKAKEELTLILTIHKL